MSENIKVEIKPTKAQLAAINIKDRTLLVSAAAGSGKTSTLTDRIIDTLIKNDDADISKMLIVTFTRAAAAELREKIFKALSKRLAENPQDERLNKQLIKLGSANISTIDSFYFNIIKQNFTVLGISASARIVDASELDLLKKKMIEEIIDRFYDTEPEFPFFAECFIRTKSIYKLSEPLLKIYSSLLSCPEGVEFIKNTADGLSKYVDQKTDLLRTPYGNAIKRELIPQFEYYTRIFEDAKKNAEANSDIIGKRIETYKYDAGFTRRVYDALSSSADYFTLNLIFSEYDPPKLGAIVKGATEDEDSLFYKNERDKIKKKIIYIRDNIFGRTEDSLCEDMSLTAKHLYMLYGVISEFHTRLCEEKQRRNIMDFDDIKRYTYKLLVTPKGGPTEIARRYAKQFTDIYIDEYQDVDLVQDLIFSAISNNNRFMVGDIKQSIYGFRGAAPKVFANYRERFYSFDPNVEDEPPASVSEASIFMSENFRCDRSVIDFTNLICSRLFGATANSIGYTSADDLKFHKLPPHAYNKAEIAVILTDKEDSENDEDGEYEDNAEYSREGKKADDSIDNEEYEAEYIAEKISSLVGKEKLASGKDITVGDIAILYRSNKIVSYLTEALAKRGILCSEGGGDDYFENPDVLLVLSLLNTVDNPHRDIHLAAVLCSPLFEFTLEELITIRKRVSSAFSLYDALLDRAKQDDSLGHKCKVFDEKLSALRSSSLSLPVDRFLRVIFESDLFVSSGLLSDRNKNGEGGNLLRLYDYARSFESGSFKGLYNFIEFINDLIENDKKLEITPKGKSPDRVTLTTMHHSKGLEFPICFICGTGKKKNMKELYQSLLYNNSVGVAMKLSDASGFSRANTPMREAIFMDKFIEEIEEEMRILYVALTRARERLYITATKKSDPDTLLYQAKIRARYTCRYTMTHCMSFIDWLLIPFGDENADLSSCTLKIFRPEEYYKNAETEDKEDTGKDIGNIAPDQELLSHLRNKYAFSYEYSKLTRIPAKLSVSKLSPTVLDENDTAADLKATDARADRKKKTPIPDFFITDKKHKASAAERGTATHLFLQFCDLERARALGVKEEISRLVDMRFIPQNIADIIYEDDLEKFIVSPLADRILSASQRFTEQRFNILLPALNFSQNEEFKDLLTDESLAVQGVIDLILIDENGDIELYDYKTDRLTPEELLDDNSAKDKLNASHALQLSYYAHAVELMFGKKCKRVCIYSTHAAKLYDADPVPLRFT